MVMQFQGLENPIQSSPRHRHTSSGFIMEMMSMKPDKGKTLFTGALGRIFAIGLRKWGAFV